MTVGESNQYANAVRMIFEYEGTDIRLVSRQRVEKTLPSSDESEDLSAAQGFWVELRDAEQNTLYRRILNNPVRYDAEVFSEDPERSIARAPVEAPHGTFAVLVPDIDAGDHVALVSSPLGRGATLTAAAEVARFALRPGTDEASGSGEGGR